MVRWRQARRGWVIPIRSSRRPAATLVVGVVRTMVVTWAKGVVLATVAAALLLLGTPLVRADVISLYGDENVGTAGAQFLRIPVGARSVAMGKAYTACATDGAAIFWNPAGIVRTPGRKNLFLSHSKYAADMDLGYFSYHWRGQNYGFGLIAGTLRSGEILRTDEFHQEGTGTTFRADQYVIGLTIARAMTDRFSIGGTVKLYQENLDEFVVRSPMVDLGILYFVGLGDLRIGFAARNFGPDMQPEGAPPAIGEGVDAPDSFQKFAAPTVGAFGAAYTLNLGEQASLLTTMDFNHPSDYSESFRFGGELSLLKLLLLRAGYETSRDEGGFAAGFGVRLGQRSWSLRFDYAYSDMGSFGTIHHFSLDFAPVIKGGRP